MKNSLALFFCLLAATATISAQSDYNNDWIDYGKTYYKFKVGTFGTDYEGVPVKKGVVRITKAGLASAGLDMVPVEQLQLWRNGQEVPVYTSIASGLPGNADYIEFWGEAEDGKPDEALYKFSAYQLSNYWSLETDSASYFLTVNPGANKRYTTVTNAVGSATIQPEKYFTYTIGKYFREQMSYGYGPVTQGISLHSSSYDAGEGFTSYLSGGGTSWQSPELFVDMTSGQKMTVRFNFAGSALNSRNVVSSIDNTPLSTFALNNFNTINKVITGVDPSVITNDNAFFYFQDQTTGDNDNFVMSQIEMDYPRKFNFGGHTAFEFYLPASDTGRYLKIINFSSNGVAPVLYDIDGGKRYVADITIADTVRFLLQPSAQQYHLVLVRGDGSAATSITTITQRSFTDFSKPANQGDYLIITNPVLYGSGSNNYIEQYRDYRHSDSGGGYNAKIIDITDLEDQFAYGIKWHPLAIKNFLRYARNTFAVKPAFAFLIGKGVEYGVYRMNETDPLVLQTNLVPTFGTPGSDNLMASDDYDPVPATPIGRLSAVSPAEVGAYLAKIQQYEKAQQDTMQTVEAKGWMKNVLQLVGVNDAALGVELDGYMNNYASIISDTSFGGSVTTFSKAGDPAQYPQQVTNFTNIFNRGSALVNYFGHSSSTDLDFSLDNPANYNNTGKYPVFIVNGCLAGNIFDYDAARLSHLSTISEKFVLQPQKGAIGYLSTSSFGVVGYLNAFTSQFYKSITARQYGKGFGIIMKDAIGAAFNAFGASDFYAKIHAEQFTFHGDPALKINSFAKPDFAIQQNSITASPSFISVADDSFSVKIVITNLGKATNDSVHFSLLRKVSGGAAIKVFSKEFYGIKTADSVTVRIPVEPTKDKGNITFTAWIDDNSKIGELNESNNKADITITISSAEIRPVYPYNYAIVNTSSVTLAASTADPLDTVKQYKIEVDTTALFNSGVKTSYQITSGGGVIQKTILLPLDNTVYYWRVSPATNTHWNQFSFIHRSAGNAGFEQAHFYQHTQSSTNKLVLDSVLRKFNFSNAQVNLFVKQAIYPYGGSEDADFSVAVNGTFVAQSACVGSSVIFNVFDPLTFKVYANTTNPNGAAPSCKLVTNNDFEFYVDDPISRDSAVSFLDHFVHDGDYVVARSIDVPANLAPQWAQDTLTYGHNNSLYNRFKDQGIDIDGYSFPRCYIFIFKKNDSAHFSPVTVYSNGYYDAINAQRNINVADTIGYLSSPKFGPGKAWSKLTWQGYNENDNNISSLNVIGVDTTNTEQVLYTLDKATTTKDISAVDAKKYPYIKLQLRTQDSLTARPYQLQNWTVEYTPVAEGAVAPNIGINLPDSINFPDEVNTKHDTLQGYVVFKNVSISNFAPLKVKLVLTDSAGAAYTFELPRAKALAAGDTAHVSFNIDVMALPAATYSFNLLVNSDNDQPEQFLFNNAVYKNIVLDRHIIYPAHLLSFTAQPAGKGVQLSWKATNEINFSYYGVEYGTDGNSFAQIGTVAGVSGSVADIKHYGYLHGAPVTGKNYYRLKMVDKDGKYSYSNIVMVDFDANYKVQVYPNPFTTALKVAVNGAGGAKNTVKVLDMSGKVIIQQTFTGGFINLDVSSLAAGTYMLQVNGSVQLQSFKVQKQNM
ncbi:MAG TPA: C25 family cysteine peptidase [Chitinophagaceae bacterium]|nr:C25 family cysteine peptidase [Chitinophagaceae bacterium]